MNKNLFKSESRIPHMFLKHVLENLRFGTFGDKKIPKF